MSRCIVGVVVISVVPRVLLIFFGLDGVLFDNGFGRFLLFGVFLWCFVQFFSTNLYYFVVIIMVVTTL